MALSSARPSARRSICEVQTKVTPTYIDVHAALSKNVATNQNVIGREVIEHGKVTDELNPILGHRPSSVPGVARYKMT